MFDQGLKDLDGLEIVLVRAFGFRVISYLDMVSQLRPLKHLLPSDLVSMIRIVLLTCAKLRNVRY